MDRITNSTAHSNISAQGIDIGNKLLTNDTMAKKIFAALLLVFSIQNSAVRADEVVRLTPVTGAASEYSVAELLRVELSGDSIRFIGTDGAMVAEVYKYDYVQLTIADNQITAVDDNGERAKAQARKVVKDEQVYILFGDKLYRIDGTKVR